MMQRHRIRTEIGKDQRLTVELKQDYDLLEILSLKFTQKDIYTSLCADYGVVCGRISVNDGVGVANARISIFIPLSDEDAEDPVISELYPYTSTTDRNEDGYRYNLLPSRKQHSGHTPTGTFPDQEDILGREEVLEVYEKYYKYTAKTNDSGDFMIWGVPVGPQTLHVEVDMSDMGCNSLMPYDFIYEGVSSEKFENNYTFMSSDNLDGLPQIVTFEKSIEVFPFWGNEDLCEIGITRTDFDLKEKGIRIEPYAIMMGGSFTDSGKDALRVNCNVDNQMGEKCRLTTFGGDIEAIRFSGEYEKNSDDTPNYGRPILEAIAIDSQIDEHGRFFFRVPMNERRLITNEFGDLVETTNPRKGIATEGTYRFRFSLNEDTGERNRFTAKFLVPNIREVHENDSLNLGQESTINKKSYAFSTNLDDYPSEMIPYMTGTDQQSIDEGKTRIPQDYFYKFRYSRVYTVSQYLNKYYKKSALESAFSFFTKDRRESFIGIKEIWPAEKDDCSQTNNFFPINEAVRNHRFNFFIIGFLILLEQVLNSIILFIKEFVLAVLFDFAGVIQSLPLKKIKRAGNDLMVFAKKLQYRWISRFSLVTYPDCEKCAEDNEEEPIQFTVEEIDINEVRGGTVGTTIFSNQYLIEEYQTSFGAGCNEYEVTETTNSSGTTISYNSCGGGTNTYTLAAGEVITVYATSTPSATTGSVSVSNLGSASGSNLDLDLYFTSSQKTTIQNAAWSNGEIDIHRYVLEVEVVPSNVGQSDPQGLGFDTNTNDHYYYFEIGRGTPFPIDSEGDNSINGLYAEIGQVIAAVYNQDFDDTNSNSCHSSQGQINFKRLIYIDTPEVDTSTPPIEDGCSKYDTIYDPDGSMNLVGLTLPTGDGIPLTGGTTNYSNIAGPFGGSNLTSADLNALGFDGTTYAGIRDFLLSKNTLKETTSSGVSTLDNPWHNGVPGESNIYQNGYVLYNQLDSDYDISFGDDEDPCGPRPQDNYAAVVSLHTRDGGSWWWQNKSYRCVIGAPYKARANRRRKRTENGRFMDPDQKGTISGYSEFRDGVYTIVPLAGKNHKLLADYIRRKRLGMVMCGGITSYIFSDSWLSGALYFFQFMKRGGADDKRYCTDNLVHVKDDNGTHFYYRSTPWSETYNSSSTDYDKGFYGQNRRPLENSPRKEINYPTTVIDLGPKISWINEVCVDPELDPNCSVVRSIGSTSFKPIDDLMEYVLQSKEIKEKGRLDAPDLFDSRGNGRMDGDIVQLLNYNTQTGIYPFEIEEDDSPYLDYIDSFDGQGPVGISFVYSEDDPDTETIEYNGYRIRVCINKPGYLGDNSQYVPYYRWNTWGDGFGDKARFNGTTINPKGENQDWVDTIIYTQRIQEMKANLNTDQNTNPLDDDYYEPYALPPIRDCLEVNGVVDQSHDNYKEYNGNHHMELTGPFHFMFGLRKGNTSWDKFIENFGPK